MTTQLTVYTLIISISRTIAGCGTFPSIQLSPITSTSSTYRDPNSMGTCLFDSRNVLNSRLSTNFKVSEFVSKGGEAYFRLSPTLIECLQKVRSALNAPLIINSGYRSVPYNTQVGGATLSRHMSGTAADVGKPSSVTIGAFAKEIICQCRPLFKSKGNDIGLGLGVTYIHVDMRPVLGSWIYSGASMTESTWKTYITSMSCAAFPRALAIEPAVDDIDYDYNENNVDTNTINDKYILLIATHSIIGGICLIVGLCIGKYCKIRRKQQIVEENIMQDL